MKKKNRAQYEEMRQKKIDAKNKENAHKIDYGAIETKNFKSRRTYGTGGSFAEMALLTSILRSKRRNRMLPTVFTDKK